MSIDTGVDPENSERGPAGTLTSYKIDTRGLLRFRGKKAKFCGIFRGKFEEKSADFAGFSQEKSQNSRKNRPVSREISGGKLRRETISKNSRFRWIFWGQIQLKSISFVSI